MNLAPEHVARTDSWLARRDPRWRLVAFTAAVGCVAVLRSPLPASLGLFAAVLLAVFSGAPVRFFRDRLALVAFALVPFLVLVPFSVDRGAVLWEWQSFRLTDEGLLATATLASRTLTVVTLSLTLLATAPPHVTLAAAGRLGVPAVLVHLARLTYRYAFLLLDELNRLRVALRVRAFRNRFNAHAYRTIGNVTGTLLVRGFDRADRVAHAMACRGFDRADRTLIAWRSRPADGVLLFAMAGTFGGLVAWDVWR